jgi:hypothetical protein
MGRCLDELFAKHSKLLDDSILRVSWKISAHAYQGLRTDREGESEAACSYTSYQLS